MSSFEEIQRFRQKWLWGLILTPFFLGFGNFYLQSQFQGFYILSVTLLATISFLYFAKLVVKVEEDGIHVRLIPLHVSDRIINFDEIKSFSAEDYRPIKEFGGWGIRWRPGKIAYSTSGSEGVRIKRKDKRDVMIGSKKPEKLAKAIKEMKK